ncbi:MAG: hypothetical protein D6776_04280 [Planctomycetota bacterium]|nr:MAG: hypothetical protein D6776_04280 [Planctomycetota bacterium]
MTEQDTKGATPASASGGSNTDGDSCEGERLIIRQYPKAVFFYPMAVTALVCGVAQALGWASPHTLGFVFMCVFFFNLVIVSFEFTRHVSMVMVLAIVTIVLLGALLKDKVGLDVLLGKLYRLLNFEAQPGFYFGLFGSYVLVLIGIVVDTRFDYWEIRGNEILHHHGFLGDVERFPAPNIQLTKEITDVFEHLLLGSGTLVIRPSNSERPIVLENVPRINRLEDRITQKLHALRVTIDKG